jgi:hypothetical protein
MAKPMTKEIEDILHASFASFRFLLLVTGLTG